MSVSATAAPVARPFEALWDETAERLQSLGLCERELPPNLASAVGGGGRTRLRAAAWAVGPTGRPLAECRIVRIVGASSEVVNTMIFPTRPEALPVYAAELLVFGGRPRLAFVDLQAPGMPGQERRRLAELTRPLAARFAHLRCEREAPDWAVEASPGGYVYTRPEDGDCASDLLTVYRSYLDLWATLATGLTEDGGPPDEGTAAALADYKRRHVAHSPGTAFLGKVFGPGWAVRFLDEFLYR
jgi:hypothetical protein